MMKVLANIHIGFVVLFALSTLTACEDFISEKEREASSPQLKNIILVIGDGMGPQQIGLLQSYAKQASAPVLEKRETAFERLLKQDAQLALSMTYPASNLVVDSAASASQIATGEYSGAEMIGLDAKGYSKPSLFEKAKAKGLATGLVSDTRLTHATPAAFAAHERHRSRESEIAEDMLALGPEVMLSGGLRYWLPQEVNDTDSQAYNNTVELMDNSFKPLSKRKDSVDLLQAALAQGYTLAFNRDQLQASTGKVLGLFSNSGMANGIVHSQRKDDPARSEPTLLEMSQKALQILSQDEDGFVLMIEAGQIDWAAHDNDTGTMLHEMLKLNETLTYLASWIEKRSDALLVVTADHETGGFGFSYSANDLPEPVALEGDDFENAMYKPNFNFGKPVVLDKLSAQKKSYTDIFYKEFNGLQESEQSAEALMKIVNSNTAFPITVKQARRILQMEENPFYVEGHKYLGEKHVPEYYDNEAFFVYQNRLNLLAMEVSKDQHAVWSTGTHTSTPVLVFAKGPYQNLFSGFYHHTHIGELLAELLEAN